MDPARSREIGTYFLATFAWSWLCWAPVVPVFRAQGLSGAPWWAYLLLLVGSYGPTLMAVALTARAGGRAAARALARRLAPSRGRLPWLAFALVFPSLLSVGGMVLLGLGGESLGGFSLARAYLVPIALLAAVPFGPLAEELGWRGYALPRLRERWGRMGSSIILGVVWAAWHMPLFWAPAGTSISGAPVTMSAVAFYVALLVGFSVVFTWMHEHTDGDVFLAVMLHATFNAEVIFLFLPNLGDEARHLVERLSLVPLGLLVACLAIAWRHEQIRLKNA